MQIFIATVLLRIDPIAACRRADPDCGRPIEMAEIPLEGIDAFLVGKAVEAGLSVAQIAYLQAVVARNRFKRELPVHGPDLVA